MVEARLARWSCRRGRGEEPQAQRRFGPPGPFSAEGRRHLLRVNAPPGRATLGSLGPFFPRKRKCGIVVRAVRPRISGPGRPGILESPLSH
ncbi:Hypothetical predicted protein [Podarcis lilfordi]|uniref:Uncharacterized protein n=1 Tax=Podarcis lilfordi TaxID=74358 RepID=A0AA35K2A6_9SAUR|nr:Hypothetical predicted protein [Podarcis lilfordi]